MNYNLLTQSMEELREILLRVGTLGKRLNEEDITNISVDDYFNNQISLFKLEEEIRNYQYYVDNFNKIKDSLVIVKNAYFNLVIKKITPEEKVVSDNVEQLPKSPGVTVTLKEACERSTKHYEEVEKAIKEDQVRETKRVMMFDMEPETTYKNEVDGSSVINVDIDWKNHPYKNEEKEECEVYTKCQTIEK